MQSPLQFFGFEPGSDRHMIRWDRLLEYYRYMADMSDRVQMEVMGPTSEGSPFVYLVISSAENLKNLDRYVGISKKLFDPRGLSVSELEALYRDGKAVCVQQYSVHSNEVGGAQMCPRLVYDLATAEDGELFEILENVIFVMIPCGEPDGEIIFTDWYNKYKGTPFEGTVSPYLRHNYAGHSNNRDAFHETVVESKYIIDILLHKFCPQAFQDHHHQCPDQDRMSITPPVNPICDEAAPLLVREHSVYGAWMAEYLENAGRQGIVSGDEKFDSYPSNCFYETANLLNIAGMLTENADALIATPLYVSPDQLSGRSHVDPCRECPSPWEGGWWHLSDITEQQYLASRALLLYMAQHREKVLRNMAFKALSQTERGKKSPDQAWIIPSGQRDESAFLLALRILARHRVEIYMTVKDAVCGSRFVPKGSAVVPLAQPAYAFVRRFLEPRVVQTDRYSTNSRKSDSDFDGGFSWFIRYMGVEAYPARTDIAPLTEQATLWEEPVSEVLSLPLSGARNDSYAEANRLLAADRALWRDMSGNFYGENAPERRPCLPLRVGLLKMSFAQNEEEGFARGLLKRFDYPFRIVMDRELRADVPENVDVLILPGDALNKLIEGDRIPDGKPPEFQSGLGTAGATHLREFVKKGGRLIAWEQAVRYVIGLFELPIRILQENPNWHGSTIRMLLDPADSLNAGMPAEAEACFMHAPILRIREYAWETTSLWKYPAYLAPKDRLVSHGPLEFAELAGGTPAVIRIPMEKGEIVLYTFDPKYRFQADGTYKLLFNALYTD